MGSGAGVAGPSLVLIGVPPPLARGGSADPCSVGMRPSGTRATLPGRGSARRRAGPRSRSTKGEAVAAGMRRGKSVEDSIRDTDEPEHRLKKSLSGLDLTVFVVTGVVAQTQSGPAVGLSFVIAGTTCGLAALCYAEFASTVPVAGSAYTFSYATFGEFVAWIIGWDLILEFAIGAAAVSVSWSGYLQQMLGDIGLELPSTVAGEEARFNIPAMVLALAMTAVLVLGIKLSSRYNAVVVAIKVAVVP